MIPFADLVGRTRILCAAMLIALGPCAIAAQTPGNAETAVVELKGPEDNVSGHRVQDKEQGIQVSGDEYERARWTGATSLWFQIVVGPDGHVESAEPVHESSALVAQARKVELARTFEPWTRDGKAIRVKLHDFVDLWPPDGWGQGQRPFPAAGDTKELTIGLSRGGCFGTCPAFSVTLLGDGTVRFRGGSYVLIPGLQYAHVDPAKVLGLAEEFRAVDFFALPDDLDWNEDDSLETLTITVSGHAKTVQGDVSDHSPALKKLMADIETAADTARWITGDERTAPWLIESKWDFAKRSPDNLTIYSAMVGWRSKVAVDRFVAARSPIFSAEETRFSPVCVASAAGDFDLVRRMVKSVQQPGALPVAFPANVLFECLGAAAASGNIALFDYWLDRGASLTAPPPKDDGMGVFSPLETIRRLVRVQPWVARGDVPCNGFLSGDVRMARKMLDYSKDLSEGLRCAVASPGPDRIGVAQALLAAGADVTKETLAEAAEIKVAGRLELVRLLVGRATAMKPKASLNEALMGAVQYGGPDAAEIVRLLLASGADPNWMAHNGFGLPSVLFVAHCWPQPLQSQWLVDYGMSSIWDGGDADSGPVCAPEVVKPLLAAGLDVNAGDDSGYTPLMHYASSEAMLRELLADGADPGLVAKDGTTALKIAQQYNCATCAQLLEAALRARNASTP